MTYRPEDARTKTVLLDVRSEGRLLVGVEVAADGDTRWTEDGTTETTHVIEGVLVMRRVPLRMDNDHGVLVEAERCATSGTYAPEWHDGTCPRCGGRVGETRRGTWRVHKPGQHFVPQTKAARGPGPGEGVR